MFKIKGQNITVKKTMKYLGIRKDNMLSWVPHLESLRTNMAVLYKSLRTFSTSWHGINTELVVYWYLMVGERRLCYVNQYRTKGLVINAISIIRSVQ